MCENELMSQLLERLRAIDQCIAEGSVLVRTPAEDREELQRALADLDVRREARLDKLEQFLADHEDDLSASSSGRQVDVARGLLDAVMRIRAVRLLANARDDWSSEFYWDLYYIENRLAYAALRELDPQAAPRPHM
ncbi:MAG: hypothetical protein R3A48_10620 [Polyangiales bacterium]